MQWLGGEGSAALTEDADVLDMIFTDQARATNTIEVQRTAAASHQALMSAGGEPQSEDATLWTMLRPRSSRSGIAVDSSQGELAVVRDAFGDCCDARRRG